MKEVGPSCRTTRTSASSPDQAEKRGLVTDVAVPIAQGVAGGLAGAWAAQKLGGQQQQPPPKKDD
jgi:hypothetical protein